MKTALKERWNAPQGLTLNRTELDWRAAMQSTCGAPDCPRPSKTRGLCNKHYERLRRKGTVQYSPPTADERFWSKVCAKGVCWEWTGAHSDTGYGWFWMGGRGIGAHRASWTLLGPASETLSLRVRVGRDHRAPLVGFRPGGGHSMNTKAPNHNEQE